MSQQPREQIPVGQGGYAPNPQDSSEAYVLKNLLVPDRDGWMRPRPGISVVKNYTDITHISQHPGTGFLILIDDGTLHYVDPDNLSDDNGLDTGWPTGSLSWIKHCTGQSPAGYHWIAPKCAAGDNSGGGGTIKVIDNTGTFGDLSADAPLASWVEAYGVHTFATNSNSVNWSRAGDSLNWSDLSSVNSPHKVGELLAFIGLGDNQALMVGKEGMGLWTGSDEDLFAQQFLSNQRVLSPVYTACDCGGQVFLLAPGPALRAFRSAWSPMHFPILEQLRNLEFSYYARAYYDPVMHAYCLADLFSNKTFIFDLDRQRWIGYWDQPVKGIAVRHVGTSVSLFENPGLERWVAVSGDLCKLDSTSTSDPSGGFSVEVQTAPSDGGRPEAKKQLTSVFVKACGVGSTYLRYRNSKAEAWTDVFLGTDRAPNFCKNIPRVSYRERIIKWQAEATQDDEGAVAFHSISVEERVVGESK